MVNIKQKIDEGWVHAKIMFEIAGKPKEHIIKSLENFIVLLKKADGIEIINEEIGEPKYVEDEEIWTAYNEVELLVEGIEKFVYICVTFTPAHIEILKPRQLAFTDKNLSDWLNELLSLLHHIGMKSKVQTQEAQVYIKNLNVLARNSIILALTEELTEKQIVEKTGMDAKTLNQFLEAMIKEGRIIKSGKKYKKQD